MNHYLLNIVKDTTLFIERNITEELDLDMISENVNISKFHLLRIWRGATAMGIMEYVRRRRLALSLHDLLNTEHTMEFISCKYGFGCERTFNRAFKTEYNITPAKWSRKPIPLDILDQFNWDFINCAGEGLVYFHSIAILPEFALAGKKYEVNILDNQLHQTANRYGVKYFYDYRHRIINPVDPNTYYGLSTVPREQDEFTYYFPSFEINEKSIVPFDLEVKHVKAHKYGIFKYMGAHRPEEISSLTLKEIWNYIQCTWMPTVEFNLKENFHFEYIDYSRCNKEYSECELYYPISTI